MKEHITMLLLFTVLAFTLKAQVNDPHIIGNVTDSKTNEHIPFVTIRIIEINTATYTDATGHYKLSSFPAGTYTLEASAIGYVTKTCKVEARNNVTATINFEIEEDNDKYMLFLIADFDNHKYYLKIGGF